MKNNVENSLQNLIVKGMMGDRDARIHAVMLDKRLHSVNMSPICMQWLLEFARTDSDDMRSMYLDEVVFGKYPNVNWMEVELMGQELAQSKPDVGYYLLAMLYDPEFKHLPDVSKMVQCLQLASDAGNRLASMCLAEHYWLTESEECDLAEIRALVEKGITDSGIANRFALAIDVCDEMEDFEASMRYLKRWHKEEPKLLEPCMRIAFRYLDGTGVAKNEELALRYFEKGAYMGDEDALYRVGMMNMDGCGCRRNIKRGMDYLNRAIAAGSGDACSMLGGRYVQGEGVPQDVAKGIGYYNRGAELQHIMCCVHLARLYYEGQLVQQDWNRAAQLMDIARNQLEEGGFVDRMMFNMLENEAYNKSWPVSADYSNAVTEAEMEEAIRQNDYKSVIARVYKCLIKAPLLENVLSSAWFLMQIRALNEDERWDFVEQLRTLADILPQIAVMVGDMYYQGVGVKRNALSAMMFYKKALESDYEVYAYVRIILGLHEGVLKGGRDAVPEWLQQAVTAYPDYPPLLYMRALLYRVGLYVEESHEESEALLHRVQEQGGKRDFESDIKYWQEGRDCLRDLMELAPAHALQPVPCASQE